MINPEGLKHFPLASYYKEKRNELIIDYSYNNDDEKIIHQVQLHFPDNINLQDLNDPEFITDHIRDYIEDDAVMEKQLGLQVFEYYSPTKDFKYKVIANKRQITVSSIIS